MSRCCHDNFPYPRDSVQAFGITVSELSRHWRNELDERLRPLGFTQAGWLVIVTLRMMGPLSQTELAAAVSVESPTMVRQLDKLEQKGFVIRVAKPGDRRVKIVELAPAGVDVCEDIKAIAHALRDEVLAGIDPHELEIANRVLCTIRDRFPSARRAE